MKKLIAIALIALGLAGAPQAQADEFITGWTDCLMGAVGEFGMQRGRYTLGCYGGWYEGAGAESNLVIWNVSAVLIENGDVETWTGSWTLPPHPATYEPFNNNGVALLNCNGVGKVYEIISTIAWGRAGADGQLDFVLGTSTDTQIGWVPFAGRVHCPFYDGGGGAK